MKNKITTIVLLILLPLAVVAGKKPSEGAVIQFQCETYDYHNITQGSSGICYFVYANKGTEPLVLSSVSTSCGCTVPYWSKKPLLPGKSAKIKVVYNTSHLGDFRKVISVKSNAINNPSAVLRIKGKVVAAQQQKITKLFPGHSLLKHYCKANNKVNYLLFL